MAFKIRTGYEGDLSLFKTPQSIASYGVLLAVLCAAPLLVGSYFLSQIVFVLIYTIVGIGLVLLSGYAGQTSIGHAAFLAIGAYIAANATKFGVPIYIYLPEGIKDIAAYIVLLAVLLRRPQGLFGGAALKKV